MKRREFFTLLGSATAWPVAAGAQQTAMAVVGFLNPQSPDAYGEPLRGLRQGLKDAGYVEGENLVIEYRWADNQMERLPALAADLVRRRVAVILTTGGPSSARAAKAATTTIPIVFNMAADPVELGLIASLARPGGNVTGITFLALELTAKRLELLREMVPDATRVGVLTNPADSAVSQSTVREMEAAGRTLGLQIQVFNADTGREIEAAFEIIGRERPDALFVAVTPFMVVRRIQLVQRAAFHRIPTAYPLRDFAEAGGLMSYGASLRDAYRQVGDYAGHILNGAKPAEMPVVQSTKFELVINHPTARMLGLTVPPTLLSTADEVIE